jgi:hypothetical protein
MDVGGWLRSLGLGQYEANFRDNKIDVDVLPQLTAGDLRTSASQRSAIGAGCSPQSPPCLAQRLLRTRLPPRPSPRRPRVLRLRRSAARSR